LALLALTACWLLYFNLLSGDWSLDPQYNYGYLVPFLGASLIWRRWPDRPAAVASETPGLMFLSVGLLLLQLPLNLIQGANPEWRLLYWVYGFQVLALTFCLLYRWGGGPWIRHFGPAWAFMLIAVPWPSGWEQPVIQGLMRFIAGLTVDVAGLLGIPALQHGNVIQISAGLVGIDEACSGVRSLQSALMVSLFLGEMHCFSWLRRGGLLVASLLFVLLANLGRTTTLVWTAAGHGLQVMKAWHDTIGTVVMLIVLPGLLVLAHFLKPKTSPPPASIGTGPGLPLAMSRWVGLSVLGWLLAVQVATELWYRVHETGLIATPRWSVAWPVNNPQFKTTAIAEESLAMLHCSSSEAAVWKDESGNQWSGYVLLWNPGKNSVQMSSFHRPEYCFPAAGAKLADDFGQVTMDANGIQIPFHHLSFTMGTGILNVFYCLWPDRVSPQEDTLVADGSQASRLRAVLAGRRDVGMKALEIVVQGPATGEAATTLFKAQLPAWIKRD